VRAVSVLVLSGSLRANSVTDAVGRHVTAALVEAGVATRLMAVRDLALPMYDPDVHTSKMLPAIAPLFDAVKQARAMIWCTPAYHRTMSGSFKNVLDYFELMTADKPAYLTGKAVGIIAVSGGIPASVTAITSLEFVAHALRAFVLPYTVPVPFADKLLDSEGKIANAGIRTRIDLLVQETVAFLANYSNTVARPSVSHGAGAGS
jgi:FMN reductase